MTQYRDFNPNMKVRVKTSKTKTVAAATRRAGVDSLQDVARPLTTDHRSPLAKARDEWLESAEGRDCMGPSILRITSDIQYLQNRLVSAFIAGANWSALHLAKRKRPNVRMSDGGRETLK